MPMRLNVNLRIRRRMKSVAPIHMPQNSGRSAVRMMRWWADELDRMKELGTNPQCTRLEEPAPLRFRVWLAKAKGVAMPSSGGALATIPVGMVPKWVAVGPGGTRAYVTMSDSPGAGPPEGAVAGIDTATKTLTATIAVCILPTGVVVAPEGC